MVMLFHASGVFTTPSIVQTVVDHRVALLTSFADHAGLRRSLPMLATRLRAANSRLPFIIDSGAFSAWNRAKHIDLQSLIDCCNWAQDTYSDVFDFTFVALDRIAGSRGEWPTKDDAHDAAQESQRNYDEMRKRVHGYVMPVFHGVDPLWLAQYFRTDAPYLGLSVSQDLGAEARRRWVTTAAPYFTSNKLHGFAMTGTSMLRAAPWYSVDSAAWSKWAGYGAIAWVRHDGSLQIVAVSSKSPRALDHRLHLNNMAPYRRDLILRTVAELGFTKNDIQQSTTARAAFNVVQFKRACSIASESFSEAA